MADLFDVVVARKLSGGGGGSGSSDFSTAEVTVVGEVNAAVPFVMTTEMGAPFDGLVSMMQTLPSGLQIPLYKGKLMVEIPDDVTVSGNIESFGNNMYLITGDCTITIS